MTLHINHPDFEPLANALAAQTGETPTEAVLSSLRARLQHSEIENFKHATKSSTPEDRYAKIMAIVESIQQIPILDSRSAEEILGYDDNGLPS